MNPKDSTITNPELSTENKEVKDLLYTPEEANYRNMLIKRLVYARDEREKPHPELDGMTYTQYYESNRKKALSFIPPKINRRDIRIVTGTTREKSTTLVSTLLNLDLGVDVTAFDKNNFVIANLGADTADLVQKSRELELYRRKRGIIYRELCDQGDVFVEEYYAEEYAPVLVGDNKMEWRPDENKISDFKKPEVKLEKKVDGCRVRRIKGTKVYLGSVRTEYVDEQDLVAVVNLYDRTKAEAMYGTWDRWKNVPQSVDNILVPVDEGALYKDWNITSVPDGQVAEIRVYMPKQNRFMIFLNGVMMLPIEYPMTAIAPAGRLPISQGKLEPISDFAYSKGIPAKTKVDQEILDEITRVAMLKFRQGANPAMGHRGKSIVNPSIFDAGKVTSNMTDNQLFPLLPPEQRQITNSDFGFYKMIKESIDEKSVNAVYSGNTPSGDPTATQINSEKEAQMKKLGLALDGVVNLEISMVWNRIYNIYANWTKPVDTKVDDIKKTVTNVYRSVMVESAIDTADKGYKMIRFDEPENYPDEWDIYDEEEKLKKQYGRETRISYLNPKELQMLKFMFAINVIPSDKSNSDLAGLLFERALTQSFNLFGPEAHNIPYIKQRWAAVNKESFDKWFAQGEPDPAQLMQLQQNMQGKSGPTVMAKQQGTGPMQAVIK